MKILLLSWTFYIGGIETHLMTLSRHLRDMGHSVTILSHHLTAGPLGRQYLDFFSHIGVKMVNGRRTNCTRLLHSTADMDIDVVNTHSTKMMPLGLQLGKTFNIPVVATVHGLSSLWFFNARKHRPDHLVAVSHEVAEVVKKVTNLPVSTIENGVDTSQFIFSPGNERFTITFVGRMDRHKIEGFCQLSRAVRHLQRHYEIDFKVLTQLERPEESRIGAQTTLDTSSYLQKSHVVFGTGRGVMEGMASGCVPIVLGRWYDGPVLPDTVDRLRYHNFSGRFSTRKPQADQIEDDLTYLITHRQQVATWQRWAASFVRKHFDARDKAELMLAVLDKKSRDGR